MKEKQFVNNEQEAEKEFYPNFEDCPNVDIDDPEIMLSEASEEDLEELENEDYTFLNLNRRIKELRKENKLTQMDMAKILGIQHKQYWLYEQVGYSMNIEKLAKIAMFYNVSIDWLSGYCDVRKPFGTGEETEHGVNGFLLNTVKKAKAEGISVEELGEILKENDDTAVVHHRHTSTHFDDSFDDLL